MKLYSGVLVFYLLSLMVSPYGVEALIYPVKTFMIPEFIGFYEKGRFIAEALPPDYIFSLKGVWCWALGAGGLAAVFLTKRGKFLSALLLMNALLFFMHSRRASVFFALAAVYVIVECARQNVWKEQWALWRRSKMIERMTCVLFIVFFTFQVIQWGKKNIYDHNVYKKDWSLDVDPRNPVKAVQFLLDQHVEGNVFANYNLGGYLIWQGYPQLKPFVDGRQFDQKLFTRYLEVIEQGPQKYWDRLEKDYDINIVLLEMSLSSYYALASYLFTKDRWQFVFIDGRCLIFVRKGVFDFPDDVKRLDERLRALPLKEEQVMLMQGLSMMPYSVALPQRLKHPLPHYISGLEEGLALFGTGFKGEGVRRILGNFAVNPVKARGVAANVSNVLNHQMK